MVSLKYKRDALRRLGCIFLKDAVIAHAQDGEVHSIYQNDDLDTAIEQAYKACVTPSIETLRQVLEAAGWYEFSVQVSTVNDAHMLMWYDRNSEAVVAHANTDMGVFLAHAELKDRGL